MWHNSRMRSVQRIFLLVYLFLLFTPLVSARAQSFSAGDLLAAINALRAARGLPPYQRDGELMAYAQKHSEYQAKIGQSTHVHSDGSTSGAYGITENIAAGSASLLTPNIIISQIWADALHTHTLLGYETGFAGVGIAVSGDTVYVTLDVRPGQSAATLPSPDQAPSGSTPAPVETQIALVPIATAAPGPNGLVVHEVGYGQALWSIAIAYGVKIDEIRELNGLPPGSNEIYAGQKLVIRRVSDVTPAVTETIAVQETASAGQVTLASSLAEASSTPEAPSSPETPTLAASETPIASVTQEEPLASPAIDLSGISGTKVLAVSLIILGVIGVVVVLVSSFKGGRR